MEKDLSHDMKSLFQNEKRCLLLLSTRNHPNIIPFFGAYVYGTEVHCFLFPKLDMDLENILQAQSRLRRLSLGLILFIVSLVWSVLRSSLCT